MTETRSTNAEDYQDLPQPVSVMPKSLPDGYVIAPHEHVRDQLFLSLKGVMRVTTADNTWLVPPERALIMPAGREHRVLMCGNVEMLATYIVPDPDGPAVPRVVTVTPLLRALITALAAEPVDFTGRPRAELMAQLIHMELEMAAYLPSGFPLPVDPRLQAVCAPLIDDPALDQSLDLLADGTGASAKTLARLFEREMGMGFDAWRRHLRFATALPLLEQGHSVKRVAGRCGYRSAAAFTHAFRQHFGQPPSAFR